MGLSIHLQRLQLALKGLRTSPNNVRMTSENMQTVPVLQASDMGSI